MVELVQQLLYSHNCVIIPNFGAFIGNYAPAEIHLMDNKIVPPHKTLAFNRSLQKNDGVLISSAAQHYSLPYAEAEAKVLEFAATCNATLVQHGSLIFKHIGRLVADTENNIRFQPYLDMNFLTQSYGLPVLDIEPIHRLKEEAKSIQENYQRILHPEKLQDAVAGTSGSNWKKWVYGLTAVLTALVIGIAVSWNVHNNTTHRSESSIVPSFDTSVKPAVIATPANSPENSVPATVNVVPQQEVPVAPALTPPAVIVTTSSIVIGAFFEEARANKLKAEAESKGYSVTITKDSINGLFRTAVMVDATQTDLALQKIKAEINPRAWVFCVKCGSR